MRSDELPHAGINTLMYWVRKQEHSVVKLDIWAQPAQWSAHITLRDSPPLHARIQRRGAGFTVSRLRSSRTCPYCSPAAAAAETGPPAAVLAYEPLLFVGDY